MKKILLLTQNYYPQIGGGIRYKKTFVEIFRKYGYRVDVLCVNTKSKFCIEREIGGVVYRAPKNFRFGSTVISIDYIQIFKKIASKYDHLHFNFPSPMPDIALVHNAELFGDKKVTCFYHADIVPIKMFSGFYNKYYTKRFLNLQDKILVSNPNIIKSSPYLNQHRNKIQVVPFGLTIDQHFQNKNNSNQNENISFKSNKIRILFVGRVSRYKGVDLLINAVKDKNEVELIIAGKGPLLNELRNMVIDLQIEDKVKLVGYVSDNNLMKLYDESDIFVLPSIDEGEAFGYVLIEAMAFGNALISTELGTGTSWVNIHNETGFVVKPNNIIALSESIEKMIQHPALLKKFKKSSLERFEQKFSLEVMESNLKEAIL